MFLFVEYIVEQEKWDRKFGLMNSLKLKEISIKKVLEVSQTLFKPTP